MIRACVGLANQMRNLLYLLAFGENGCSRIALIAKSAVSAMVDMILTNVVFAGE
jgi:hypothetical protein